MIASESALKWSCYRCGTRFYERVSWCPTCLCENLVGPAASRPHSVVEQTPQVTSARQLAAAQWTLVTSSRYSELRFLRGALVLVYGPAGGGKSTFALGLLDGFDGRALVFLSEEGLAPAVGERLVRLGIRDERMTLVARASLDQLAAQIATSKTRFAAIDSVTAATLTASELRHLLVVTRLHALVAVQQVTKAGTPAGSNALSHEADVAIEIVDGRWTVTKSRYQSTGTNGEVFNG